MSKVLGITAIFASAALGYAVYFDYQRRNSPEFRKALKKKAVKHKKHAEKTEKENKKSKFEAAKKAVEEDLAANPLPTDLSEKESYFVTHITMGEQLAALPDKKTEAALCFYKALAIYPNPTEILAVLQKATREDIYEMVVMMIAAKPPPPVTSVLNPDAAVESKTEDLD